MDPKEETGQETELEQEHEFTVCSLDVEDPGPYGELFVPEVILAMQEAKEPFALGVEEEDTAAGVIGGFLDQDEEGRRYFLLSNFYIAPDYRDMGAGSVLFDALLTELSVLAKPPVYMVSEFYTEDEDTELLYTFLREEGMEDVDPEEEEDEIYQRMYMDL